MSTTPEKHFALVVGAVFKEARKNAGLSKKKLAEESGVGRTGIISLEAGDRNLSLLLCKMLADGMKTPLANLVDEIEKRLETKK